MSSLFAITRRLGFEAGLCGPDSQYRYYTFQHVKIVEAIQFCVELDIPLKQFKDFLLETDGQIDYAKLMAHGTRLAEEKMKRIRKRLAFLKEEKTSWPMRRSAGSAHM